MISRHVAQVLMAAIVLVPLWWASPPAAGQQIYIMIDERTISEWHGRGDTRAW
jgi:hypothetical protein